MKIKIIKNFVLHAVIMTILLSRAFGAYTKSEQIAPGLTYTKSFTKNDAESITDFFFEYSPNEMTAIEFLSSDNVYGFSTVGNMIKKARDNGKNTVGAVNADFFAPQTGVPMSAMIKDGDLITSDDSKPAFAFDSDGNAFIGLPGIKAKMLGEDFSYEIGHINKTPTPYTVYLLTDKFAKTTKTSYASTEIVLMPVNDEYDEKLYDEYTQSIAPEKNEIQMPDEENADTPENTTELQDKADSENEAEPMQMSDEIADDDVINVSESAIEQTENVPFDFTPFFTEEKLKASCEIKTVVVDVRHENVNGEIPEGAFVVVADDRPYKEIFSVVEKGDVYTVEVFCDEKWINVSEAIGGGSILLRNGEKVEQESDTLYTSRNPRSAIGIKPDGTIVLYACDGRRTGHSVGMTSNELCERLLEIGCVDAMNFDGGGSVTCFATLPGMDEMLVNKPSGNVQRAVANAVAFVNSAEKTENISGFYMALDEFYVLCGESKIELPETIFTHDEFYNATGELNIDEVKLKVNDGLGYIDEGGYFVSGDNPGICTVFCRYDGVEEAACQIYVTDSPDLFTVSASSNFIDEKNAVRLSAKATKNGLDVLFDFEKLKCSVDGGELFGLPFENDDVFISADGLVEFKSDGKAEKIEIVIYAGDKTASVRLEVIKPFFYDMNNHWAKETAQKAYELGIINGIADEYGEILFAPDNMLNYAQACTMLARFMNLDEEKYVDYDFETNGLNVVYNASTEWALPFVVAMFEAGYINPLLVYGDDGKITVDINELVTRENAMRILGYICPPPNDNLFVQDTDGFINNVFLSYSDIFHLINDPFSYNIMKSISYGVFAGYPDGTLKPENILTRAHMATVLVRLSIKKDDDASVKEWADE